MRLFLIGFMSSGKSTVGRQLARKLNMEFVDIDNVFEEKYKISISDFFEKFGENKFRELERNILTETIKTDNILISTGGGTPCFYDNIQLINKSGISIYLKLHPNSIFDRLRNTKKQRPLINKLSETELKEYIIKQLNNREVFYNQANIVLKAENIKINNFYDVLKKIFEDQNLIFPSIA
jgi:shikimate kinase